MNHTQCTWRGCDAVPSPFSRSGYCMTHEKVSQVAMRASPEADYTHARADACQRCGFHMCSCPQVAKVGNTIIGRLKESFDRAKARHEEYMANLSGGDPIPASAFSAPAFEDVEEIETKHVAMMGWEKEGDLLAFRDQTSFGPSEARCIQAMPQMTGDLVGLVFVSRNLSAFHFGLAQAGVEIVAGLPSQWVPLDCIDGCDVKRSKVYVGAAIQVQIRNTSEEREQVLVFARMIKPCCMPYNGWGHTDTCSRK